MSWINWWNPLFIVNVLKCIFVFSHQLYIWSNCLTRKVKCRKYSKLTELLTLAVLLEIQAEVLPTRCLTNPWNIVILYWWNSQKGRLQNWLCLCLSLYTGTSQVFLFFTFGLRIKWFMNKRFFNWRVKVKGPWLGRVWRVQHRHALQN